MTDRPAYRAMLAHRHQAIVGYTGLVFVVVGLLVASPLLLLPFDTAEAHLWWAFAAPALLLFVPGAVAWRVFAPAETPTMTFSEGAPIVVLAWVGAILVGMLPLMFVLHMDFTRAVFEATSGWTTTGLTVVDVSRAPRIVLLYRSITQLAGGAGLAILMVSALRGPTGPGLASAEGRGQQLVPHVVDSAKMVVSIYVVYAVVGTLALWAAGMNFFDAINQAFTAISTGGFGTHADSIGYWNSPWVEGVLVVLMLLGSTNFVVAYAVVRGRWRVWLNSGETRVSAVLLPLGAVTIFFAVATPLYANVGKAARVAIFETVSALSTTGFSTVSYAQWHAVGWFVLMAYMLVGGGSGSTAGGYKQTRVYMLYRVFVWELQRQFMPHSAVNRPFVLQDDERRFIEPDELMQLVGFGFVFLFIYAFGTAIIMMHGYAFADSSFEMASALGTVGLSVGVTSAKAPAGVLWVEIVGMFFGRLEVFVILVGLYRMGRDLIDWVGGRGRRRHARGEPAEPASTGADH